MPNDLELLESLSKYKIELGIFTQEGLQTVAVSTEDADGAVSISKLKVSDIMYFTEYGTISIPGRMVLERCLRRASQIVDIEFSKISDSILESKESESSISAKMRALQAKIEEESRAIVASLAKETGVLSSLLGEEDENKYIFDPGKLSKYVRCKITRM